MSDRIREMIQMEIETALREERRSLSALISTVKTTYIRVYNDKYNPYPSDGPPDAEAMLRELSELIILPDVLWDVSVIFVNRKRTDIMQVRARTEDHAKELVRLSLNWTDEPYHIGHTTKAK